MFDRSASISFVSVRSLQPAVKMILRKMTKSEIRRLKVISSARRLYCTFSSKNPFIGTEDVYVTAFKVRDTAIFYSRLSYVSCYQ